MRDSKRWVMEPQEAMVTAQQVSEDRAVKELRVNFIVDWCSVLVACFGSLSADVK
jgi:hypothetical protein